ncbi:MAG: peptidase S41 [Bacteroides sp. SM23_62_1]|nr:MAG: peptidase S41 [Bacteroides sp. SM23_62_1]
MKNYRVKRILVIFIILLVLSGSSVIFISFSNDDFKLVKSLEIYYSLFRELNLFYVDETDPEKLVESSIEGMLEELDPYTSFIPESEQENFNFMTTGQYGGIGALIRRSGDYAIIAEPYYDFPAAKNNLRAGDTIVAIDGISMKEKEITNISDHLKGTPGTPVRITLRRIGVKGEFEKTLIRERITINNVPYYGMISEQIGYVRLSNFTTDAAKEVKNAVLELKRKYKPVGIILDVRGNPGGLLIESVDVANLFIEYGQEIVITKGRVDQWDYTYKTRGIPVDTEIPVVVLVSRSSASASEILAGSMQDLDRGVIIGQRTYGKGLVQTTRNLAYNSKLKVTTAKYYIPSGRCIQALDYSTRNEDGSVGAIPDSLISEYQTKNGRKVYDGGGILPDIITTPGNVSQFTISLFTQNIIFDFATIYASCHDSILPVKDFVISDELYAEFMAYVIDRNFTYSTRSEDNLKKLIESSRQEKYYELAADEFAALEKKLAHDNEKDLNHFRDEIARLLKQEIVLRYYYQWGSMEAAIENDPEIEKAVEVLKNNDDYLSILGYQTEKIHASLTE